MVVFGMTAERGGDIDVGIRIWRANGDKEV